MAAWNMQPFDLGLARSPWGMFQFLESIGVGLLAELMSEIDEGGSSYVNELSRRETRISAALGVLDRVLRRSNGTPCEIELDNRRLSGEYLLVEVLNFGAAGPNLELHPPPTAPTDSWMSCSSKRTSAPCSRNILRPYKAVRDMSPTCRFTTPGECGLTALRRASIWTTSCGTTRTLCAAVSRSHCGQKHSRSWFLVWRSEEREGAAHRQLAAGAATAWNTLPPLLPHSQCPG